MPSSTVMIAARQRQATYELVRDHLVGLTDVGLACERGDFETAARLGREFAQDIRLLEDLGWAEQDDRELAELTMPAAELDETLRRLRSEAAEGIAGSQEATREDDQARARYELVLDTCEELIEILDLPEERS